MIHSYNELPLNIFFMRDTSLQIRGLNKYGGEPQFNSNCGQQNKLIKAGNHKKIRHTYLEYFVLTQNI